MNGNQAIVESINFHGYLKKSIVASKIKITPMVSSMYGWGLCLSWGA